MASQVCQVCNSQDSKYKCPDCRASSCSLPCFRQHKDVCLEQRPQQTPSFSGTAADNEAAAGKGLNASTLNAADLNELFEKFPGLRAELRDIYTSTRDPAEVGANVGTGSSRGRDGGGPSRRPWKPETGIENGLTALNRALRDDSTNPEALSAFMKLLAERSPS